MYAIRAAGGFDGSRFLPDGVTVFVDGDHIVGVESGRVEVPDEVAVTAYPGTVLPGLIDCHTHLIADATFGALERIEGMAGEAVDEVIIDSLRAHAAAGETTVRDLGDRGFRTLAFRQRPGLPRVVAAGPPLTTPNGHCHFLGGVVDGDVRRTVSGHVERGVDVIKVMASGGFATPGSDATGAQFSVEELSEIVDAAHGSGLPIVAHAHSLLGIQNALAAGVDGIEHLSGLSPEGLRIDDELLDEVARRGVYVDLTLGDDRSMHALIPTPPPSIAEQMTRWGITSFPEFYQVLSSRISRLREHGIAVITGVDSGMAPMKRHGTVWRAISELVEGGYSVEEALAAATSVAAAACRIDGMTGRLADGYAADLLVVDGDLRNDISLLSRPRRVVVRGMPLEPPP